MKKTIIILSIILFSTSLFSQSDIIYTIHDGKIIFNCNIIEVKNGNNVQYKKDSIIQFVLAKKIIKDGLEIELFEELHKKQNESNPESLMSLQSKEYRGNDYSLYERKYKSAKRLRNFGITATIIGAIPWCMLIVDQTDGGNWSNSTNAVVFGTGLVLVSTGVPLWIIGSTRAKNNKHAMQQIDDKSKLSLGFSQNGIGLVYNY